MRQAGNTGDHRAHAFVELCAQNLQNAAHDHHRTGAEQSDIVDDVKPLERLLGQVILSAHKQSGDQEHTRSQAEEMR